MMFCPSQHHTASPSMQNLNQPSFHTNSPTKLNFMSQNSYLQCSIHLLKFIINFKTMRHADREAQAKRKYSRISFKKREKLIEEVEVNGLPLSYISKKLKIKQSTARMILRKFKESGQFRTKNFKNKRNTDLREWGTIKNAGDVQKSEQLEPHRCEDPSQENSEVLPSENQPIIEEEVEQSTYSPHLYWCYYLPAYDYISFC